jgi:TonB family protein
MLKTLFLAACLPWSVLAFPGLSGMVQDTSSGPIDGATITVWDAATGKGLRTLSSMGRFLWTLPEGDYLFKVEKDSAPPVLGAFHLVGDERHNVNVVLLRAAPHHTEAPDAGSPLRDSVRPPRSSTKPPKVRPAQVKSKVPLVYPEAERRARVAGAAKLAMIILPDGTVNDLVVLSAPNTSFAVAALLSVRQWQYSPTYLDGQPVEASLTVDVRFQPIF